MNCRRRLLLVFIACLLGAVAPGATAEKQRVIFATTLPELPVGTTVAIESSIGSGAVAERGQFLVMNYEGWVYDPGAADRKGRKFDSSIDRGHALSVLHGVGRMIQGLDKGIEGMRVGGRRTLVIPPDMGYGNRWAFGEVPPGSTLLFEVELLDVVPQQNVR